MDLWKMPDYLILHLKRFQTLPNGTSVKIDRLVSFPLLDLDLTTYLPKEQDLAALYDIFAVVVRPGPSYRAPTHPSRTTMVP